MIPWVRLAVVAAVLAGAFGGGWTVRGWRADAADLARVQAESEALRLNNQRGAKAASKYEVDRDSIDTLLRATQARLAAALAVPAPQCPGVELGRIVVPGAALCGLRDAAGQLDDDPDACKPGPAVPGRPAAPGG